MKPLRVLAVDDSAVARELIKLTFSQVEGIELTVSHNAENAQKRIQQDPPDVLLLDLEMPGKHGLELLREVMSKSALPVVICSESKAESATAKRALDLGAVDIVKKPKMRGGIVPEDEQQRLILAVRAAGGKKASALPPSPVPIQHSLRPPLVSSGCEAQTVIAIGISTGGPAALRRMLPLMPPSCPPILIVQHMADGFTGALAQSLDDLCAIRVKEAQQSDVLGRGCALLAPCGRHMEVHSLAGALRVDLIDEDRVHGHKPSVDVLFHSVARTVGAEAIGVIMTGMGDDGAQGLLAMHRAGAYTLGQEEGSCAVYGMPRIAQKLGGVRREVSLDEMAGAILHHAHHRPARLLA